MPRRAMSTAPGIAASANSIGGKLDSQPTSVSDRFRSRCKSGMTGGIASTGTRRHTPGSHKNSSAKAPRSAGEGRRFMAVAIVTAVFGQFALRPTSRPSGTQTGDGRGFDQIKESGAGDGIRTHDPNLGKVRGLPANSL